MKKIFLKFSTVPIKKKFSVKLTSEFLLASAALHFAAIHFLNSYTKPSERRNYVSQVKKKKS